MGLWRCRAARRRTGLGARRNPPRAPAVRWEPSFVPLGSSSRVRSFAPGRGRRKAAPALFPSLGRLSRFSVQPSVRLFLFLAIRRKGTGDSAGRVEAAFGFAEEERRDKTAAQQDGFDLFRAAAGFGDACAPVVGRLDVAVEGLLAGSGDGAEA